MGGFIIMTNKSKKVTKALIIKELERRDWKAFAEGFHELNIEWHAKEWREFIEHIEARQKKEIKELFEQGVKELCEEVESCAVTHLRVKMFQTFQIKQLKQ